MFPLAHGLESPGVPNWITSVAAVKYRCVHRLNILYYYRQLNIYSFSDVFASGSNNGVIKLWKCDTDSKKIVNLTDIPCVSNVFSSAHTTFD